MVADYGFGLPPGTAVRTGLVAAALGRRMGLADGEVRDGLYTGLLMHVGCVGISHESAAAFGDDIRFYRAITGTDVNDPDDVATVLDEVTRGMPADAAARTTSFLRTRGLEWARRADTGVCEVARDTARRLGLPESTQQALYHVYETWAGGWVPQGLKGDDVAVASCVARAAMEVAFFSQLGGADAAVAALRKRAGGLLDPAVVAAFTADPQGILAEADRGDPHDLMLAAEPEPVLVRKASDLAEVAAAFGDLADVKMPFLHGHSRRVADLASGGARRLGLDAVVEKGRRPRGRQDVGHCRTGGPTATLVSGARDDRHGRPVRVAGLVRGSVGTPCCTTPTAPWRSFVPTSERGAVNVAGGDRHG